MKKAFFVLAAVLLAVMLAGCDNFGKPEAGVKPIIDGYTEDGRAIVNLEIGSGLGDDSRALMPILAKAGTDFYEVVFFNKGATAADDKVYRTSWREGRTARLSVPVGDYNFVSVTNLNYAYIFAGRYEDKMLLGVGKITTVYNNSAIGTPGGLITDNTTKVDFTITPLETDANDLYAPDTTVTPNRPASTFRPGKWVSNAFVGVTSGTWSGQVRTTTLTVGLKEKSVPVYFFPTNLTADGEAASFNITAGGTTNPLEGELLGRIIHASDGVDNVFVKPFIYEESTVDVPVDIDVSFLEGPFVPSVPAVTTGTPVPTVITPVQLPLIIGITPGDDPGLCLLCLELPVYLATPENDVNGRVPQTWYLKGGLNNTLIDMGAINTGMGGGVFLGIGDVLGGNGFIVNGKW